jgi:hypothetical protein
MSTPETSCIEQLLTPPLPRDPDRRLVTDLRAEDNSVDRWHPKRGRQARGAALDDWSS